MATTRKSQNQRFLQPWITQEQVVGTRFLTQKYKLNLFGHNTEYF